MAKVQSDQGSKGQSVKTESFVAPVSLCPSVSMPLCPCVPLPLCHYPSQTTKNAPGSGTSVYQGRVLFFRKTTSRGTTLFQRLAGRRAAGIAANLPNLSQTPFFNTLTGCEPGADYFSARRAGFPSAAPRRVRRPFAPACSHRRLSEPKRRSYYSSSQPFEVRKIPRPGRLSREKDRLQA